MSSMGVLSPNWGNQNIQHNRFGMSNDKVSNLLATKAYEGYQFLGYVYMYMLSAVRKCKMVH